MLRKSSLNFRLLLISETYLPWPNGWGIFLVPFIDKRNVLHEAALARLSERAIRGTHSSTFTE